MFWLLLARTTLTWAWFILRPAGSSKPRPLFRWVEDGSVVREANRTEFAPSSNGGEELRSVVEFVAGPEHDGKTFECLAHNPTIAEPHERGDKVNLVVLCEY